MPNLNKNLDAIARGETKRQFQPYYIVPLKTPSPSGKWGALRHINGKSIYLSLTALALLAAFGGGMIVALRTPKSEADVPPGQVLGEAAYQIPLTGVQVVAPAAAVSNDVLFNTPLQMLQDYLASQATPDLVALRKDKLKIYLESKGSPLAEEAEIIAQQDHWKLILAISYAESTLGKHCYYFNCSGIGGSNIRTYKDLKNWILDFNRLLEKRYKDQTLEQMCGVYVQPCNPNWLLATKQILMELKEEGIE